MELDFSVQRDKKLIVKERNKTKLIDVDTITHLTCDGYVTTIHYTDKEYTKVSKLLKEFEFELAEYRFIRANYNTIVNLKYLSKFGNSNRKILLIDNSEVCVSRRRLHLFKKILYNQ